MNACALPQLIRLRELAMETTRCRASTRGALTVSRNSNKRSCIRLFSRAGSTTGAHLRMPLVAHRRILLFPGGNNVHQLSVYLDVADSATLPQGWSRQAHFTLTVHNQKDQSRNVVKGAQAPCVAPAPG
eukprot:3006647-Pleurochrysis_carterae.AAC.1